MAVSEMTKQDLKKAKLVIDLHGKEYQTVAYRIGLFREKYPIESGYSIVTKTIKRDDKSVVVSCEIKTPDDRTISYAEAEELLTSRFPSIEKASTDAVGRALFYLGYIGQDVASHDEIKRIQPPRNVVTGMNQEQSPPPKQQQNQPAEEKKVQWFLSNDQWLREAFPRKPVVYKKGDSLPSHFEGTWEKLLLEVEKVVTQENGKEKSLRQWLHICSNYPDHGKPHFQYKCKAALTLHKQMEENQNKGNAKKEQVAHAAS